jgi:hypothetical protein
MLQGRVIPLGLTVDKSQISLKKIIVFVVYIGITGQSPHQTGDPGDLSA